jgi:cytochrome d ubiquinol oxidase subunit II
VEFGVMVMFLTVSLGAMYMINNIDDEALAKQCRKWLMRSFVLFLVLFVLVMWQLLTMSGFAVDANGVVYVEEYKYLHNLLAMPHVIAMILMGALLLLAGVLATLLKPDFKRGIWLAGPGTVLAVMAVFMLAGYNNTSYYPSTVDLQSSLTLANSCSSEFTLRTMAIVSLIIPFVVAYIAYFWRQMDKKSITTEELQNGDKY